MPQAKSRRRIQEALLQLLRERPIEKITITEVVELAGVSRTTYYRAYYALEEVVEDLLDGFFEEVDPLIPRQLAQDASLDARLFELATYQCLVRYRASAQMLSTLLASSAALTVRQRFNEYALRLVCEGDVRREQNSVSRMEHIYVAAGMAAVICQWIEEGCVEPVSDVLEFIVRERGGRHR